MVDDDDSVLAAEWSGKNNLAVGRDDDRGPRVES
jgi:hypothetical protein